MTNWSVICPPSPVKEVEAARQRVIDLRGRVSEQRDAIAQARSDLAAGEQEDKARMARELADGRDPTSNVEAVEQLRARVGAAERKSEALVFAIEQAEEQFGEAILRNRQRWTSASTKAVADAREAARKALAALEQRFSELHQQEAVAIWLREQSGGLDRGQGVSVPTSKIVRSSARFSANQEAISVDVVCSWLHEAIEPVVPVEPPVLKTMPGPAPRAAAPIEAA